MPSQKNIHQVEEIKDKAARARSLALADYRGLTVGQMTDLRRKVKEAGGELRVAKNTLLKLALASQDLEKSEVLTGPTLILYAYEDEIAPLKALVAFSQENALPKLKAGFLGQDFLSEEKILDLATLPGREELQAKFVGQVAAPLSGFVRVLSGNIRNLIYALEAVRDSKGQKN